MTTPCYLNGKFTAQRLTGVQRVATELLRALDSRPEGLPGRWVLLCPPGAEPPLLQRFEVRHVGRPGRPLHLWEQLELPTAAADGRLLSLAGSAPWFARRQVCMLHDAAVWDQPQAYQRRFVWWYRALFQHLARRAERLLTVSAFSRERLSACLGLEPGRVGLVRNGADHLDAVTADPAMLRQHGLLGQPYLLAVASANPSKNLAALVQAFAALPASTGQRLVLVGGRNERVFTGATADADPPGVLRLGPQGDAALKALYQGATALALPSLYEGFGLTAVEAMSCGCPVLAARAAALPEVCGDAALYVEPASVASIAEGLGRIVADAPLRQRLRAAGLARVAGLRWADSARQLLACLPPAAWA